MVRRLIFAMAMLLPKGFTSCFAPLESFTHSASGTIEACVGPLLLSPNKEISARLRISMSFPALGDAHEIESGWLRVDVPTSPEQLRELLLGGNSEKFGATANVAYRLNSDDYRRLCPTSTR